MCPSKKMCDIDLFVYMLHLFNICCIFFNIPRASDPHENVSIHDVLGIPKTPWG